MRAISFVVVDPAKVHEQIEAAQPTDDYESDGPMIAAAEAAVAALLVAADLPAHVRIFGERREPGGDPDRPSWVRVDVRGPVRL